MADAAHFSLPHHAGRELLTGERAVELLPPTDAAPTYTRLTLSGHSFSLAAARVFAPSISSLSSLTDADLSDIIAGRNTEEAIAVLDVLCSAVSGHQLSSLNLSDNAIGARGVESVGRALRTQRSLQRLALNNDGLQGQAVGHIVEALLHPFNSAEGHHPTSLRHVELYRNLLQDEGPRALVPLVLASPSLSHFCISSSRVSSAGGLELCTALSSLSALQLLNLSDSNLGPEAGLVLASQLLIPSKTQRLTHLQLGDIGVNDRKGSGAAILAIIVALRTSCPQLQCLELQSNDLSPAHARQLARALRQKRSLAQLNLEDNDLRSSGAISIAQSLTPDTHPSLTSLNLSSNAISSTALPALLALIKGDGRRRLSALHLNSNRFTADTLDQLRTAVEAAGAQSDNVLGSLSDNDEDEEEEEEEEEVGQDDDDGAADEEDGEGTVITQAEEAEARAGDERKDEEVDKLADELAHTKV